MASPINVPLNAQLQNTQQLTQQIQAALNAARLNLGGGGRALSSLSQPLGRLTGQADEFSKSLDAANARVLAFGASVGIVNAFTNAFKNLVASTIEVEKAIKAITVVGDQFNNKTKELSQGLFNVAKTTGQSFAEVSKAALEFSRQGLGVEETLARTQNALILTRLTGLDAAKAVEGLTAAANGFAKAGLSTTQILNKLAAVDQAFAVSSADLIEGFNRSAAVAQNAGVTFDELAGIITALQQETSRGGAVIGNALKTIFTRLQDTSTLNQLQNLGVAVQDLEGNLLPARQILQNLAKDVEGLGQITRAGIFKDVAGTFQINQLISLVSDLNKENSVAAAATRKAAGATNEAFAANEKLNQSLDAIINKVALTGKQLGALLGEIGLSDNLKGILDGINSFLEGATNLLQGEDLGSKFAKGIVKGIGSVLAGPGLMVFLAVIGKLTLDLVKFGAQSAKTFFGIGKAAKEQQLVQEAIVQTLLRNQSVLNRILSAQGGQNAQAQAFLSILNQQEQALQNIRTLAGGIAAPLIGAGYGIGPQGGIQRRGRAAGGYLPAQEAADVRRGVGGASPSSQVVAIPNFAFGGGKRGTMIANTSEYIVPNYAGGGSAIFNQDMVKTMGLPAGAKKIGAAGGFVPNFARYVYDSDRIEPDKNALLNAILQSTAKKNLIIGPAGSGKSTYAKSLGNFITSTSQLSDAEEIDILSSAARAKGGGFSKNFSQILQSVKDSRGKVSYLYTNNLDILSRRSNRFLSGPEEGDLRSKKQLGGSRYAPLNQYDFISQIKSASSNFELIRGAGGFIPNFAAMPPKPYAADVSGRIETSSKKQKVTDSARDYALIVNDPIKPTLRYFPAKNADKQYLALVAGIDPEKMMQDAKGGAFKNSRFTSEALVKKYTDLAIKDAEEYSSAVVGKPISPVSVKKLSNPGVASGLVGAIFENGITAALKDPEMIKAQAERDPNAPFDFIQGENSTADLNKFFGINRKIKYVEAKYSLTSGTAESFGDKIHKQIERSSGIAEERALGLSDREKLKAKWIAYRNRKNPKEGLSNSEINNIAEQLNITSRSRQTMLGQIDKALGIGSAAGGYIPNFAASALQQAIAREKSAGLSSSQIYVDQSSALKSPSNPMGLMVANTRDEPAGGFQGVARARKEGMNPKTYGAANGFVPNYASLSGGVTPQAGFGPAPSSTAATASEKVAKGFADVAGQVFLVQSALSFLNGAVGDSESSFAKLTAQVATSVGNIASLGLLGQQIASTNPVGTLGKFAKNLGVAGIAVAGAAEIFSLANFAIKEFSGENSKAALASAKLADASGKLAIQFDNLSKTRQVEITKKSSELLGQAGFQSFFGKLSSNIFGAAKGAGGDIGGNADVQKAVAQLATLGASEKQISQILESAKVIEKQEKFISGGTGAATKIVQKFDITQASDVLKKLEEELSTGLGKTLDTQFKSFETALAGIDLSTDLGTREKNIRAAAAQAYDQKNFADLTPEQQKLVSDRVKQQIELNKQKQEEQKVQNNITFGERLTTEIAKKRIDSALEIIKLKMQETTSEEEAIQLRMETLDLSNREKIIDEARLKILESQKKAQTDIVDSVAAAIDKAQGSSISVDVEDLDKLKTKLESINFDNLTDANFNALAKQLDSTFKIGEDNAKNLLNSVKEERSERARVRAVTEDQINRERDRKLRIDEINQSLNTQLSTLQRIAQTAQSIASLNISVTGVDIAKNEAEITKLQALLNDPNLTASGKENIERRIVGLQKVNNELKKTNELESVRAKQIELSTQISEKQKILGKTTDTEERKKIIAEIDNLIRKTQEETNNYNAATIAIDANTQALSIQEQQIGKVTGAYASLAQQLESFRRGAGERIAGAELGILSSTDPTSLARSTIQRQVEFQAQGRNLNNQDYYKFINQETALREKQFELQVEASNVRRVELQNELDLMNQISEISAATDEERLAKIKEIIQARTEENQSFGAGFTRGIATLRDKTENFKSEIGQQIPELFASNLAQGLNDALSGAKSLKDALQDAAVSFLNAISQASMQNLANKLVVGLGGIGKASGGLIKGGSGVKDDIPAMLMGGEYVIKKSAVNKYGSSFLDALNNGKIRGYANGGGVQSGAGGFYVPGDYGEGSIRGKSQLLAFAGQSFTSGQYDRMGSFGLGGASVNLEAESARLTTFGRENSPLFERVQGAKEEAFKVYLDQLNQEKQYRDQLKQIEEAQKQREKQLISSLVQAAASVALNVVGGAATTGFRNAAGLAKVQGAGVGGQFAAGLGGVFKGGAGYGGLNKLFTGNFKAASTPIPFNRAAGGMIYGGSGVRDDVPAMLTGGEFVLNNRATRKLGVQNLSRLNSGEVGSEDRSGAVTEALLVKLDELIQATRETSSENVVVNVSTTNTGEVNENGGGNERDLQRKIRAAVLEVIAQEKRLGGSLNNKNR